MSQIHRYRDLDGTLHDMSAYAPRLLWTAQSKAEQGTYGSWSVTLDDPFSELDIIGHRHWFVEDDESEDADDIIFGGYTGAQTLARMEGDQRRKYGPLARVITVELFDGNAFLNRTVMKGEDCKRDPETDVERMQWLLATSEAGPLGDTTTYVQTTSPVNMDGVDYRGRYLGEIVADCAGASGKNWFVQWLKVGGVRTLTIWYGRKWNG